MSVNRRDDLMIREGSDTLLTLDSSVVRTELRKMFTGSFKLRQVSAAGDNSAELELNATGNVQFDAGRFGFEFVASPRHADALVITGPISENMPIPNRGINEWEYKELLPQYKNRKDYYEKVKPCRIEKLRKLFKEYPPKIVVAYGSTFWKDYEELFKEFRFEKREPFKVAQSENTVILLTPHFVSIQMNGQIEKLVSLIKEKKIIFHLLRNKC